MLTSLPKAPLALRSVKCPQCYRDLTSIRIVKPSGCFSEFVSAGLDPLLPLVLTVIERRVTTPKGPLIISPD